MKVNSKNRGFVRGTLVVMADGREKPIEQIRPGDYVLSFDEFDADAPLEPRQVLDIFNRIDSSVLEVKAGESTLLVAKDQMFIGPNNDWKEVYNHSLVVDRNGQSTEYTVSKISKGKHQIYDITVEDNHSLIANGLRVHNSGQGSSKGNDSSYGGSAIDSARQGESLKSYNSLGTDRAKANVGTKQTTGDGQKKDPGPAGQVKNQSASNSQQKRGGPGDNSGLNSRGARDYGNSSNQTVSNGSGGRMKKSKRRDREEPTPMPSANSVSSKLIDSVYETAQILDELVAALDPLSLTASKMTVQTGVDTMFSHANTFLATIFSADMTTYDKMELISAVQNIMSATVTIRKPFEETIVTAAGKATALTQLALVEIYCVKMKAMLDAYTTKDTKGNLDVYVDDRPVSKKKPRSYQSRRGSDGRYSPIGRDGGGGGSASRDRGSYGFADSPGTQNRGNSMSSMAAARAADRASVPGYSADNRSSMADARAADRSSVAGYSADRTSGPTNRSGDPNTSSSNPMGPR